MSDYQRKGYLEGSSLETRRPSLSGREGTGGGGGVGNCASADMVMRIGFSSSIVAADLK